jgi:steroid delta-isomerase-like uncharacterized protein
MTIEENKQIVRRAIERVFNAADPGAIEALYAADFVNHTPPSQPDVHGIEGVKRTAALWHAAFPDMQVTVDDEIAEGDRVMTRWTMRGTHLGTFRGLPPTCRVLTGWAMEVSRIAGGKIAEQWLLWDTLDMLHQLGPLPPPLPATSYPHTPSPTLREPGGALAGDEHVG